MFYWSSTINTVVLKAVLDNCVGNWSAFDTEICDL